MNAKRHTPEQIIHKLRQAEVELRPARPARADAQGRRPSAIVPEAPGAGSQNRTGAAWTFSPALYHLS